MHVHVHARTRAPAAHARRFPRDFVQLQLLDARLGYSELLKVMVRFALVPVVAVLCAAGAALKAAAAAGHVRLVAL